jgi:hypothetical protein
MNRIIFTDSTSVEETSYEKNRGLNASEHERIQRQQRRAAAGRGEGNLLNTDVKYLLGRRKEVLYRWFSILKWLRLGLLASGDPVRQQFLRGLSVVSAGAYVQTHHSAEEDCQAAHLMHCNLQFVYGKKHCNAFDLFVMTKDPDDAVVDYRQFVRNIFAAVADVFSIVNEIDSFLEKKGAKAQLVNHTIQALRNGLEPATAVEDYMTAYRELVASCQSQYQEVLRKYLSGDSSLDGRIASGKSVAGDKKRERKLALHGEYLAAIKSSDVLSPGLMRMIDHAHRSRHLAWGKAPLRLL